MDRDIKSPDLNTTQCPKCRRTYTDQIEVAVIALWGYCTGCDHQMLDQDYEPMDFEENEQ